jgi:hypothetical protein
MHWDISGPGEKGASAVESRCQKTVTKNINVRVTVICTDSLKSS